MGGTSGRTFTFDFGGPLPAVWSAMADTARYNAAAALPKQTVTEIPARWRASSSWPGRRSGRMQLEWEDLPCNWVREHWFEHRRRFTRGPLALLDARLDLTPAPRLPRRLPPGSGAERAARAPDPRRWLPALRRAHVPGPGAAGRPVRARRAGGPVRAADGAGDRCRPRAPGRRWPSSWMPAPTGTASAERLVAVVAEGLEVDAERIRPLPLARRWGVPERHVIEACLEATRLGMLELRWDLLCPRCRGAKVTGGHARPDPDRRPLRHLQHRLRPQLLAQRRAGAAPVAVDPADRERRVLPARADEHAAHLGARHGRGRRGARHRGRAGAGPLPPAHAGVRPGSRHRV